MMLDKKDDFFKMMAEDVGKFKAMIHRHDMEHKDEIIKNQGREEEREKINKNNVLNMHKLNVPVEQISLYLNISVEEVKKYINE